MRKLRTACVIFACCSGAAAVGAEATLDRAAPLPRGWYAPHQLLPTLARRDGVRWAMPETLSGNALVGGGKITAKAALDEACKAWGLSWTAVRGVVVVHVADDVKLKRWTTMLRGGGPGAVEAAWELGWLRDARAVPALAEALAGKDVAASLAAARAIEVLDRRIPLGRTHRVEHVLSGRLPLAAAFPARADLAPLLDSPYPPVRAASLRLLLGAGGASAKAAAAATVADKSTLVRYVRQQMLYPRPKPRKKTPAAKKKGGYPPPPATPAGVRAACRKMLDEIPNLARRSEWEQMRLRARIIGSWSQAGHEEATDALIELSGTKAQRFWYPAYVLKFLADSGGQKAEAKLMSAFRRGNRATMVRGLEKTHSREGLLTFTAPYLREQTVCYVTARKAGRAAYDGLVKLAAKASRGACAAVDALGAVGGPRAVKVLEERLAKDEPGESTLAFRSAKALGRAGGVAALGALLRASRSPRRLRRHASALFLGRIGGPKATARLKEIIEKETDRLVRAAAAEALEEIGTKDAVSAARKFRKADAGVLPVAYRPRNKRLGPGFPVNKWVDLGIRIRVYAAFGEMGWNYDAANKLFFRQGGCSGYTNELTAFDLGTGRFVQRRPNEEMAGWDDRRPPRGCSAGRTWDPYLKVAWIGPAIGGSASDVAIAEYYNRGGGFSLSSYDLATDRFRSAARAPNCGRYVYDWKHGLMIPVIFTHRNFKTKDWWVLDTRAAAPHAFAAWQNKTNQKGDYPFSSSARYTIAAVHQEKGILVLYVPPHTDRYRKKAVGPETWTWNPKTNVWKNMRPKVQPGGSPWGRGFVYDPFNKVLILQGGMRVSQYGGDKDSMTWTYDVDTNKWTDMKPGGGPGNPWVGAMAFDPEHNAVVLFHFRQRSVWAYRYKQVPLGTEVKLGVK